jgi:feruloyl-CoA synthase
LPETGRPMRQPRFAEAIVAVEQRPDGAMILRSPQPLGEYPRAVGVWLEDWAARAPERLFLAERDGSDAWRRVPYAAALAEVRAIGQALLDRGLGPARPVMILSDNGIDHALLMLAAMHVGIPVVPVSTAYSRISRDFARLRAARDLVAPGLIFADDGERYAAALAAIGLDEAELVVTTNPPRGIPATDFAALRATRPTAAVDAAFAALGSDTVAKILLTSGSTGEPKGVINTQRMLCSNQAAYALAWPFLAERPPVLLDWLPWNHTFGGNSDFNMVLRNGGTLYIDDGRPVPGLIGKSVANLREIAPTLYLNVPRAFGLMLDPLERDADLARNFFRELDLILYAGAALPQNLWQRLEALALRTVGETVTMVSAWGTTETAPLATVVHYPIARAGNIDQAGPYRRQARDPRARSQRHAGLLAAPRPNRRRLRRGRLLSPRRCGAARGSGRAPPRHCLRRQARRELQALVRHLGKRRRAARGAGGGRCADHRGCRHRRPRPRRDRSPGFPQPCRLPRSLPASCGGRDAFDAHRRALGA